MKHKKWSILSLGIALFTAGCATAVQLEGLELLTQRISETNGIGAAQSDDLLRSVADEAEASSEHPDIVQIGIDEEDDLVVFAIFAIPQTNNPNEGEAKFRASVESIWQAAIDGGVSVNSIAIASMRVFPVNTLDRGLAPGGWLMGAIQTPMEVLADYLGSTVNEDSRAEFWLSNSVQATDLDQPYVGVPNHPLRSPDVQR